MADTTANRAYPYPESTDDVRPYADLQALADALDIDIDAIVDKPVGRLVAQSSESLPDNVAEAINFAAASESGDGFDSHGYHDETTLNGRVVPTKAGIYRFTGRVHISAPTSLVSLTAYLRKNGSTAVEGSGGRGLAGTGTAQSAEASAMVPINGSGDFIELMGLQDSAGALNSNASAYLKSSLEWEYIRPLIS
jgi:hypothetical protein